MNNADNSMDTYDSLLSYDGGNEFFEAVLGGLACIDSDIDSSSGSNGAESASDSSSDTDSESDSEDQSPLFEKKTGGFDESDKESVMSEESPLFDTAKDEIEPTSPIDEDMSILLETPVEKNSEDVKNLIKEMLKSL
jgi:hypothetical protein